MRKTGYLYLLAGLISLSLIVYLLFHFYDKMGGFEEPEVIKLDPLERNIAGITYQGKAQTIEYEEIMNRCADLIRNEKLDGTLSIISYKNDTLESNEVDLFIGIALQASEVNVPDDFEIKSFNTNLRYATVLTMHPVVRPSVETIENLLILRATQDGRELQPIFAEFYYAADSMTVEAWTK